MKWPTLSLGSKCLLLLMTGALLLLLYVALSHHPHATKTVRHPLNYLHDNASADTKVEALKTVTANLLVIEKKNRHLSQQFQQLQQTHQNALSQLKQSMQKQIGLLKKQITHTHSQRTFKTNTPQHSYSAMAVNQPTTIDNQQDWHWLEDVETHRDNNTVTKQNSIPLPLDKTISPSTGIVDWLSPTSVLTKKQQTTARPIYTIPMNATLTGTTLMTPLVGRIPIDGKLVQPYAFKLVLSSYNLTANGYPMPGVQGAVMSGIASGDLLGRCARGDIKSITFIFNDGTISTTKTKKGNNSLGYLSSQTGNPCLAGTLHTNAALFLGSQMALAGAQGYANSLSRSQYLTSVSDQGATINSLVGNANKAAMGNAGSAAAQAAQNWWNQRVKNSFDYVYVSNQDKQTQKVRQVVVNITQAILIDYNPTGRKVDYETLSQTSNTDLD